MNPQVVDASPRKNNLKKHQANFHYYVYFKKTNGGCGQLNISKCVIQKFLILFQQIHHKPSKVYDFSEFSAYFLKKATFSEFSAFSEISALVDTLFLRTNCASLASLTMIPQWLWTSQGLATSITTIHLHFHCLQVDVPISNKEIVHWRYLYTLLYTFIHFNTLFHTLLYTFDSL